MRSLLTKREQQILETLAEVDSVKLASLRLRMSPKTIYNRLYTIRKKYLMARHLVNKILAYKKHSPLLDEVLTPRIKLKDKPITEENEANLHE